MPSPLSSCTLVEAAARVLNTPSPHDKAALTDEIAALWSSGGIAIAYDPDAVHEPPPVKPARDDRVNLVEPSKAPRLGKGGSPESRIAILHSLAHIESWAIDLSWDIIARFGAPRSMPKEFFDDFVTVAADEARHFKLLAARLDALGSRYGALNAHDGLWNSASETAHSLEARLVIEHCVHEARGLDVLPSTIDKFRKNGDVDSADLLELIIYPEEVTHCAAGLRWFTYLHERGDADVTGTSSGHVAAGEESKDDVGETGEGERAAAAPCAGLDVATGNATDASLLDRFHDIVRRHFKGVLKPPFNDEARARAGFGKEWYMPLTVKPQAA